MPGSVKKSSGNGDGLHGVCSQLRHCADRTDGNPITADGVNCPLQEIKAGSPMGKGESHGNVARVTEISARSLESCTDTMQIGIKRVPKTLRYVKSPRVKEQEVIVGADDQITEFQVNMLITFVLRSSFSLSGESELYLFDIIGY